MVGFCLFLLLKVNVKMVRMSEIGKYTDFLSAALHCGSSDLS